MINNVVGAHLVLPALKSMQRSVGDHEDLPDVAQRFIAGIVAEGAGMVGQSGEVQRAARAAARPGQGLGKWQGLW